MVFTLFKDLLQVSVGKRQDLSSVPSAKEWKDLYRIAYNQALLGVCYVGISKLPSAQQAHLTLELRQLWLAMAAQIQKQNELMNERCAQLQQMVNNAGLKACVLKGQGVAEMYNLNLDLNANLHIGLYRQPGDIDMWVKGGFDVVCDFVQRTHPSWDLSYHRFHYHVFEDAEVEIHHRPSMMNNPLHNRKLQRWADELTSEQFVYKTDLGFYTPPSSFNKVFLLCHIYRHFVSEGVGLRQLMDYYFVLLNSNVEENEEVMDKIIQLGMKRFTRAVMWIMQEIFMLDDRKMLCKPDEKEGCYLLREIMEAGNFGQTDKRYSYRGRYAMQLQNIRHSTHLLFHYPSEVLWMPLWLIWHFFWKRYKKMFYVKNYETTV